MHPTAPTRRRDGRARRVLALTPPRPRPRLRDLVLMSTTAAHTDSTCVAPRPAHGERVRGWLPALVLAPLAIFSGAAAAQDPAWKQDSAAQQNAPQSPQQGQPQGTPPSPAPNPRQGGLPPGQTRESMWPAPTAEDWQRPCLIPWQRTWDDALQVSKETGKPILICVNMDGEIASEHYAGIRYRQPDIAALYEPYVCVVASVYRHTPRDYDELGRRIPCPRFGTVTCGEHIAIEPLLFEKYFDGKRIAPRHIALEQDLTKAYDVFYAWTTQSVFDAVRDGLPAHDPGTRPPGERTLPELVASADAADRGKVESAYERGDSAMQKSLLEAAIAAGSAPPLDLLRLAIQGGDPEMAGLARKALAQSAQPAAVSVITESLRVTMDSADREALMAALDRLGPESPRAKALAIG